MSTDFFVPSRAFTARDVSVLTGAQIVDAAQGDVVIAGLTSLANARPGLLVFIDGKKNAATAPDLQGVFVLCPADLADALPSGAIILTHRQPQRAFAQVGRAMYPEAGLPGGITSERGVSVRAAIDPSALIETGAVVEAGAVIGAGAEIGAGTVIAANAVIGPKCRVGRNCYIGPAAIVRYALFGDRVIIHAGAVIGKDGFGFVFVGGAFERMPQLGRVIIQNDVEIGANSTVDRGALDDTIIGEGTKIDNLVQIAHNVRIGRHCVVAGQCGISGSVTLGDYVMLGGGVGVSDHVNIGNQVQIAAGSGIMHNIPDGERWAGRPASPVRDHYRQLVWLKQMSSRKAGDNK